MRSRDGNYPQLLSASLLILLTSFLEADEYIISYHSASKNASLLNEKISISKAMTPCSGKPTSELILYFENSKKLQHIISGNRNEFFNYLQKQNLHVKNYVVKHNSNYNDLTTLSMAPQCFTVTFNENFVKISALK
ncbi:MAG: hypothetical protein U9P71_05330 [Campylobacterota bacterium]|nr:hypothetical protein [Campylobacterota bacterium]